MGIFTSIHPIHAAASMRVLAARTQSRLSSSAGISPGVTAAAAADACGPDACSG